MSREGGLNLCAVEKNVDQPIIRAYVPLLDW